MSLIMPDGSRTVSYGPPGSGFPTYEDFMGQAAKRGNKAAAKLSEMQPQQPQAPQQATQQQPAQQAPPKGLDMSAYRPGQAQSVQTPSQGTPYRPSQQSSRYSEPTAQSGWQGGQIDDDRGMVPQYPPSQMPQQYSPSVLDGYGQPRLHRTDIPPGSTWDPNTQTYMTPVAPPARPEMRFTDFRDNDFDGTDDRDQGQAPGRSTDFMRPNRQAPPRYTPPQQLVAPGASFANGQFVGPSDAGNYANSNTGDLSPFTSQMIGMFGQPTTPQDFYPRQQAMIAQINGMMGNVDSGTYLGQGAPPAGWGGMPAFNPQQLWANAGDMVNNGWQNPLAGLFG